MLLLLSGRGLCDEMITRPEESYRLWCIAECDLENLINEEALAQWGAVAPKTNKALLEVSQLPTCCNVLAERVKDL